VLVERNWISRLRKCPHDHCLSINAYLSHNTVANISKSFTYNMAAVKTIDIKRTYLTVTLCIRCSSSVFVCLSVCHKFMFHRNGCTDRAGSWHRSYPTLCLTKIRISSKWEYLSLELCPKLSSLVRNFRHGTPIFAACWRLSSPKVDAQYDKLATVPP